MAARDSRHSRRSMIKLAAGATALAATGMNGGSAFAQDATPSASTREPIFSGDSISIYDSGAELPTEDVTFTWLENGSGPRTDFMSDFFATYQEAHPNITVQYDHFPIPKQQQLLSVAIQNGTLPDVFQPSPNIPGNQLVGEELVAPLDDAIPNFEEWKAGFPPDTFFEGINVFGGKTYTFPITSNIVLNNALLYNTEYADAAGIDPASSTISWDEFREAARKITEAGQGEYYGFLIGGQQTNTLGGIVSDLAQLAGASGGEFNWATGDFNYTHEAFQGAMELLIAINQDGSIFPGSMQLSNSAAREQFPTGIAGLFLQGQWNIPQWKVRNPDFSFDVGFSPLADPNTSAKLAYSPGGGNPRYISATTTVPAVAGDVLHYLGTLEGQTAWSSYTEGAAPPMFEAARTAATSNDPRIRRVTELAEEWMVLEPSPSVRNPDVALVNVERRPLTPTLGELVQGMFTGQVSDIKAAFQDLQDRANAELDEAIKAAQDNGAEVTRDDWVFPNWDPTQNYSEEMYLDLP